MAEQRRLPGPEEIWALRPLVGAALAGDVDAYRRFVEALEQRHAHNAAPMHVSLFILCRNLITHRRATEPAFFGLSARLLATMTDSVVVDIGVHARIAHDIMGRQISAIKAELLFGFVRSTFLSDSVSTDEIAAVISSDTNRAITDACGFSILSAAVRAGPVALQRYLDAGGTLSDGPLNPLSVLSPDYDHLAGAMDPEARRATFDMLLREGVNPLEADMDEHDMPENPISAIARTGDIDMTRRVVAAARDAEARMLHDEQQPDAPPRQVAGRTAAMQQQAGRLFWANFDGALGDATIQNIPGIARSLDAEGAALLGSDSLHEILHPLPEALQHLPQTQQALSRPWSSTNRPAAVHRALFTLLLCARRLGLPHLPVELWLMIAELLTQSDFMQPFSFDE